RVGLGVLTVGWLVTAFVPGMYNPDPGPSSGFLMTQLISLQQAGKWVGEIWPLLALGVLALMSRENPRFAR
ncbi:MAG: hypothetical protein HC848_11210, partial [Limnobacter sp.]|nr:hypothetical protein [Limnobacter sp.]